jgi:hypothetical protein
MCFAGADAETGATVAANIPLLLLLLLLLLQE